MSRRHGVGVTVSLLVNGLRKPPLPRAFNFVLAPPPSTEKILQAYVDYMRSRQEAQIETQTTTYRCCFLKTFS
jgi:hypothetical protein